MGREAEAIGKLQGQVSDLQSQLATAQANGKDAADVAAENAVLGAPDANASGGSPANTSGGSPASS